MRSMLFAGAGLAAVLTVAVALAGGFTKSPAPGQPVASAAGPCCTEADCCPGCPACCAEDGCCWECIECCLDTGCDPSCCFPVPAGARAEAPRARAADKRQACCADGCCK